METFLQDIRYAARSLRKSPGFTAVAAATLALGIGANAAVFSIFDGILLRSLPFEAPDRLVQVWAADRATGESQLETTFPELTAIRDGSRSFVHVAAFSVAPRFLNDAYGDPRTITVARISGSLFRLLGVAPVVGRGFSSQDTLGTGRAVIVSHAFWVNRYASEPAIVGATISIRDEPYTIIGVMPATYEYPKDADVWRPFAADEYWDDDRELHMIARLAPNVEAAAASEDVAAIFARLRESDPENESITAWAQPIHAMIVRDVKAPLASLLLAVGLLLLIACANIANLTLARKTGREGELAVRTALGAGRGRLVRQLLTESLLLAALGGTAGVLLGRWLLDFIIAITPADTPRILEVALDGRVMLVMAAVTLVAGLAFGIYPALKAARSDHMEVMKGGRVSGPAGARQRAQRALVVAQVALSTMLVIGSGLLITSFTRQLHMDRGIGLESALVVPVHMSDELDSGDAVRAYFEGIRERIAALPGVEAVAISSTDPLEPRGFRIRASLPGEAPGSEGEREVLLKVVSADYFRTLGIPLRAGRGFAGGAGDESIAVVNEALVRQLMGATAGGPVGRTLATSLGEARVVGVAADVTPEVGSVPRPTMYVPFEDVPLPGMRYIIKTTGPPASLAPAVREIIWELDPGVPLDGIFTLESAIARTVASPRFNMLMIAMFAALGLALAAVGAYGVVAYGVSQRTHELGLRQALGAQSTSLLWMVLKGGLELAAAGVGLGMIGAFWLARAAGSLLYDVSPADPFVFGGVSIVLVAVVAAACYLPARRAVRADPMVALKTE